MLQFIKISFQVVVLSLLLSLAACGGDEKDEATPGAEIVANFTYTESSSNSLNISFTNTSENASTYTWNFGDGNTSTSINPQYTYAEAGTYQVTLRASDGDAFAEVTKPIVVNGAGGATDTTPPSVSSISPESDQTGVGVGTNIEIVMSEAILASSVNNDNVRLFKTGSIRIEGSLSVSDNVITFNPTNNLDFSTLHELRLNRIEDLAGNQLLDFRSRFTTGEVPDTTPPTVSNISTNNASNVDINDQIVITFSEAVSSSSAENGISIEGPDGDISGTIDVNGSTVTFTPAQPLREFNTQYTVSVETVVADLNGNNLASAVNSNFTTLTVDEGYYYRIIPFENYVNGANFNATLNMSQDQPVNIGNWSVCSNGCPGQLWSFEAISSTEYLITNEQNGPNYYLFSNQMDGTYGATGTPTNNQKWKLTEGVDLNVNGVSTWYELRNLAFPDRFYLSSLSLGISEINQDRYRNWGLVRIKAK